MNIEMVVWWMVGLSCVMALAGLQVGAEIKARLDRAGYLSRGNSWLAAKGLPAGFVVSIVFVMVS